MEIQNTENPNVIKFVTDRTLISGSLELDRNSNISNVPLAQELFQYPFVKSIFITANFIAAILTVLGYSINDTVIIFDRIRENLKDGRERTLAQLFNDSISGTLGRTINTSLTVLLVVLAIFIFGGENLKGFMFALLLGVVSGTFSTIFISSLLAFDFFKGKKIEK